MMNKGGRPKVGDDKMDKAVWVRLSEKEHDRVRKDATAVGLTISSYIRLAIQYMLKRNLKVTITIDDKEE